MKRWVHAVTDVYEFIELAAFKKEFKKLGLDKTDFEELKSHLINDVPEANLGSNVYKFRWAPSRWNTGQSGSTRVIYIDVIKDSKAYLVSIYKKNAKSNLSPKEEKAIKKLANICSKGGN